MYGQTRCVQVSCEYPKPPFKASAATETLKVQPPFFGNRLVFPSFTIILGPG